MTYKLNGTALDPQPTEGTWLPRELIGLDGNGRAIYEPLRQFEMRFGLLSATGYNALQENFLAIASTGTVIVDLPRYGWANYEFTSYTGCHIQEPTAGSYFTEYHQETRILVTHIDTEK